MFYLCIQKDFKYGNSKKENLINKNAKIMSPQLYNLNASFFTHISEENYLYKYLLSSFFDSYLSRD